MQSFPIFYEVILKSSHFSNLLKRQTSWDQLLAHAGKLGVLKFSFFLPSKTNKEEKEITFSNSLRDTDREHSTLIPELSISMNMFRLLYAKVILN